MFPGTFDFPCSLYMKLSYGSQSFLLQAASQWLELRLQLLGCGVVAGVAVIAVGDLLFPTNFVIVQCSSSLTFSQVIEHHVSGANPGMVGLAISYALGITGKLSGLVTSFTGSSCVN